MQFNPIKNVNGFKSVTWNTNGQHWDDVETLMNMNVDVLAIQEAGSITTIRQELVPEAETNKVPIFLDEFEISMWKDKEFDIGLREFIWTRKQNTFYMYYYGQENSKQNMAIISRSKAEKFVIHSFQTKKTPTSLASAENDKRTFINRPSLGLFIGNSVFFNIHPEPNRTGNEAPTLLNVIQDYMKKINPDLTWMVLGDYNRAPVQLVPKLPKAGDGRFIKIINSGQSTRSSGELDFCVVGGPVKYETAVCAIKAEVLEIKSKSEKPSDHKPVKFN